MDTLNSNLLDNDFSNASGCGLPPVCSVRKRVMGTKRNCRKVGKRQICVNVPTVKTVTNQSCVDAKARYKACINDPNRKSVIKKVKESVKKSTTKLKEKVKKSTKKIREGVKKRIVSIKERVGNAGKKLRNKLRGVMRKGILFNIKNNIHGTASRLYPAVASDGNVAKRKYKKSHVSKTRNMYNDVVKQWVSLGGDEKDLKNAIIQGHSKRFLKAPYKSFNGDDSYALYAYYTPSNYTNLTNPNIEFYGVDGEEVNSSEGVYNEETGEEEVPSQEEEVKGIRAFFAWLKGLFNRNKADENPYAEGSEEYAQYEQEASADAGNEPQENEADDSEIKDLMEKGDEDGAGSKDDESAGEETEDDEEGVDEDGDGIPDDEEKILGMPKGLAIGLGIAILAVGGFIVYKKFIAKK